MDRQPVALAVALLSVAALGACRDDELYAGAFEMPTAAAVLDPVAGGPFAAHEPAGLVANGIGGRIVLLALKQGRFLTDDDTASFLRSNDLPTGGLRLLTSVAPYAPSTYQVDVFAGDAHFEQLVEVPWIVGYDELEGGRTVPVEGYSSYYPPDESGATAGATIRDIEVKQGYTSSEVWTITYRGPDWVVEGSRSGRQPTTVVPGQRFVAEERRVAFDLVGEGVEGDVITIETWNGLVEHDVGGRPLELSMAPDQRFLAMIVHDTELDRPVLRWFDPAERRVVADVALPADSLPHRMTWAEDDPTTLYVADIVILPVEVALALLFFQLCLWSEARIVARELATEAEAGTLPLEHAAIVASWWRRQGYAWLPRGVDHHRYVRAATTLALRRNQLARLGPRDDAFYRDDIERLRRQVKRMLEHAAERFPS